MPRLGMIKDKVFKTAIKINNNNCPYYIHENITSHIKKEMV